MLDADAQVPSSLEHPRFVATPLTVDVGALDYASYMASPDVIREHSDGRWPVDGFTLSDNLVVVEAVNDWLPNDWPLATHLFRILPGETSSRRALERLTLRSIHLDLPGEKRPYRWYGPIEEPRS